MEAQCTTVVLIWLKVTVAITHKAAEFAAIHAQFV